MHQKGKPKLCKTEFQQMLTSVGFFHCIKNHISNKTFCFKEHSYTPSNLTRDVVSWVVWTLAENTDFQLPKTQIFLHSLQWVHGQNRQELGWTGLFLLNSETSVFSIYLLQTAPVICMVLRYPLRCINVKQCTIHHLIEIFPLTLKAASNDFFKINYKYPIFSFAFWQSKG